MPFKKEFGDLQTIIYEVASVSYICKAPTYVSNSSSIWQMQLVDESSSGCALIKWADGNKNFDNIALDYLTLDYY